MSSEVYCISVYLDEFWAWYNTGEICCARDRLVLAPLGNEGKPCIDSTRSREIFSRLPYFDLEEVHNIILAVVDLEELKSSGEGYNYFSGIGGSIHSLCLPISCLLSIHALIKSAEVILQSRLKGYGVSLEKPLDENCANELLKSWHMRKVRHDGAELLKVMVENPTYSPNEDAVSNVLHTIEKSQRGRSDDSPGLISSALLYDRHEICPSSDIGYMWDLGYILKECGQTSTICESFIGKLREFCKSNKENEIDLSDLLTMEQYVKLFEHDEKIDADRISSLIIYLRWRHIWQTRGSIDIKSLLKDLNKYNGKLKKSVIEEAVWFLGAFAGFREFAKEIYLHGGKSYRFMSGEEEYKKCELHDPVSQPPHRDDSKETSVQNIIKSESSDDKSIPDDSKQEESGDSQSAVKQSDQPSNEQTMGDQECSGKEVSKEKGTAEEQTSEYNGGAELQKSGNDQIEESKSDIPVQEYSVGSKTSNPAPDNRIAEKQANRDQVQPKTQKSLYEDNNSGFAKDSKPSKVKIGKIAKKRSDQPKEKAQRKS